MLSISVLCSTLYVNAEPGIMDKLFKSESQQQVNNDPELKALSFKEIRLQPKLGKQAEIIKQYQHNIAVGLKKDNPRIELMRNGEVVIISIPTMNLFAPDESTLTKSGEMILSRYIRFFEKPNFYRIVLAMNSDNTGTEEYINRLSNSRVSNVYNWFSTRVPNNKYIFPFGVGSQYPLKKNDSMENREYNRRLEIYLVPGDVMISEAKDKKL